MFLQKNNTKFINSYFMKLAFNLANLHRNMTGINPSVGCLVCKKNRILSYGVTGIGGGPHAEYSALTNLKKTNNFLLHTMILHYIHWQIHYFLNFL